MKNPDCLDPELLVAYLTVALDAPERAHVDRHLLECDACTAAVTVMHQRWRMADRIAVPVPAALTERFAVTPRTARVPDYRLWPRIRERLLVLTRLPVLMPTAFALGALGMLVVEQLSWQPTGPLTRSIAIEQTLRVRATAVSVYAAPDSHAVVLATLPAGTIVDVRDQDRDWYRIVLPDGRDGWVEHIAIE